MFTSSPETAEWFPEKLDLPDVKATFSDWRVADCLPGKFKQHGQIIWMFSWFVNILKDP